MAWWRNASSRAQRMASRLVLAPLASRARARRSSGMSIVVLMACLGGDGSKPCACIRIKHTGLHTGLHAEGGPVPRPTGRCLSRCRTVWGLAGPDLLQCLARVLPCVQVPPVRHPRRVAESHRCVHRGLPRLAEEGGARSFERTAMGSWPSPNERPCQRAKPERAAMPAGVA